MSTGAGGRSSRGHLPRARAGSRPPSRLRRSAALAFAPALAQLARRTPGRPPGAASAAVAAPPSPGATTIPVSPSTTASGVPPTSVVTTGRPSAIASRMLIGSASASLSRQSASQAAIRSGTSPREPSSCTPVALADQLLEPLRARGRRRRPARAAAARCSRARDTASTNAAHPLLGAQVGHAQHARNRPPSAAARGAWRRGRPARRTSASNSAVRHRHDAVGAVAAPRQRLRLALGHRDHPVHARRDQPGQRAAGGGAAAAARPSGRERRVLVEHVRGARRGARSPRPPAGGSRRG